jgi:hypothetical protein
MYINALENMLLPSSGLKCEGQRISSVKRGHAARKVITHTNRKK